MSKSSPLPWVVGGVALVGGLVLIASSRRGSGEGRPFFRPGDGFDLDCGDESSKQPIESRPIINRIAQGQAALAKRERDTGKRISRGTRNMGPVDGLVLHQMSFSRGNAIDRYDGVTAHFIVLPNGQIIQLHPLDEYLYAAHNFNPYTVSVEFAGNFPSANGNWYKPEKFGQNHVSEAQINAGRYLIDELRRAFKNTASPGLRYVYAHRQSDDQRGNDPGPDLWYGVGEWAIRERGMSETPTGDKNFTVGDGKSIPDTWRRRSNNTIV